MEKRKNKRTLPLDRYLELVGVGCEERLRQCMDNEYQPLIPGDLTDQELAAFIDGFAGVDETREQLVAAMGRAACRTKHGNGRESDTCINRFLRVVFGRMFDRASRRWT